MVFMAFVAFHPNQTLLCNPIIRNYFLSDAHNHRECKRLRKLLDFSEKESWNAISFNSPICSGHLKGNEFTNPDVCVCCDIDQLLSEVLYLLIITYFFL